MSERGHYGDEAQRRHLSLSASLLPDLPQDYAPLGISLGLGTLIGVLIGSKLTFHTPIRRRR